MTTLWFNEGYSGVRDAVLMIREAREDDLRVLASHRDPMAPVLDAADESFVEPAIARTDDAGVAAYGDYCLRVCAERGIDLLVAQRSRGALAARVDEFAAIGTRLAATGSPETLDLINDKARFYTAASRADIAMPWTREVTNVDEFDAACADLSVLGSAACVKPPHGVFGAGFWQLEPNMPMFETLMDTESHRISHAAMRDAIAGSTSPLRLLVLEYLPGTEWSLDCLCRNGRLIVGVARRKLGRAQRLEVEGPIFDIARRAVRTFGLSGLINLQFKAASVADDDDVRLLEINPRMSGGCLYTRYSGINLPWWHIALELGRASESDMPVPVGGALVAAIGEAHRLEAVMPLPACCDA